MAKVFVYGTLKREHCRSHALKGQRFVGKARTVARYRLYDTGAYPAMIEDENGLEIDGEVWEVDAECLQALDLIESTPDRYERGSVTLASPAIDGVQTYIYQRSVAGMPECGPNWHGRSSR